MPARGLRGYLEQIVETDIPLMGHRRNPRNLTRLFASLARNVGQPVKLSELAKDVGGEAGPIAHETITGYLDTLERLRLTEDSPAWRPHMRSKTPLRTTEVRYFVDPSLGPAALGIGSSELRSDPLATGFHFEALVVRDLRILAQPHYGTVESWRDKNGNEVDAIVTINDNKWAALRNQAQPPRCGRRPLRRSCGSPPTSTRAGTANLPPLASSPAPASPAAARTVSMSSRSAASDHEIDSEREQTNER